MRKTSLSESDRKILSLSDRKMLSAAEVEAVYGISRGVLANYRWARKGPRFYKVGVRRVLYRVEDVKAWVESQPVLTKDSIDQ